MTTFDQHDQQVDAQYNAARDINIIYQQATPRPVDAGTLAAAERLLASLPLDTIPTSAPLPPGSRMPLSANPLFVGRVADLKALAATLKGGGTAAIGQVQIAAATGLGGIGKTQLAGEFVHRYGRFFGGGVFWLSFADPASIPAEVAGCGGPGALALQPDFGRLPIDDQVRLVLSAWQSALPCLLVFDNCEDPALLAAWRPPSGGGRVLVTSRCREWEAALGVQALPLGVLNRTESIALLRKQRPDLAEADLDPIAAELGDLPLALHMAGSFLHTYRHAAFGAPDAYLTALCAAPLGHISLAGEGTTYSPTGHELHVARTFALSHDRLEADDPTDAAALSLLARAAYFAPGVPIPRSLLLMTAGVKADDLQAALSGEKALIRLKGLGLLDEEAEGAPRLHRLLAAFVRGVSADTQAQEAVEEALFAEASRLNQAGYPALLLAWQPHLRAVTDAALKREDERAARLGNELGYHLWGTGDYAGARPYYERALGIDEKTLGPDHPDTAIDLNNLGLLLKTQGDLAGARPYYERALAIREKTLGPDHPDTAQSLNNLGGLLFAQGDLAGARPYFERALHIWEKVLGPDHPFTATSLNNLGGLL